MATAQDLVVNLGANTAPLSSGLSKARGDVRGFANDVKSTMGGTFEKFGTQIQSATYAVDDFVAGFSTGGIAGGIRGAANNIAQLGSQIGGVQGLLVGVAIGAGATIFTKIMQWSDDSGKSLDKLTEKLQGLKTAAFEPTPLMRPEQSFADMQRSAAGLSGDAAARRRREIELEISQREANVGGLVGNQRLFGDERANLARSLSEELGIADLTRADDIRAALLANRVNTPGIMDRLPPEAAAAVTAKFGQIETPVTNLSEDQRKRLELLLELTQTTNQAEQKATDNIRALEQLRNEAKAMEERPSAMSSGMSGALGLMGGGPGRVTAGMGNARIPGNVGLALVTEMRGMMREGEQLGDLNQSVRDRLDEKPLGKPSEGFAGAAEQGSMEAARIVLGAMGQTRTMEIQKAQLDVAKQQVNEIKKLGVGLKTNTKAVGVVGDLTA